MLFETGRERSTARVQPTVHVDEEQRTLERTDHGDGSAVAVSVR